MSKHSRRRMAELDIESVFQDNVPTLIQVPLHFCFSKADTVTLNHFRSLSRCLTLVFQE